MINNRPGIFLDDTTLQVLAVQRRMPGATSREIGKEIGVSHVTVCQRLRRIRECDYIQQIRVDFTDLLPKAVEVYRNVLDAEKDQDRLAAARDVLRGSGVTIERHVVTLTASDRQLLEEVQRETDPARLAQVVAECQGRSAELAAQMAARTVDAEVVEVDTPCADTLAPRIMIDTEEGDG